MGACEVLLVIVSVSGDGSLRTECHPTLDECRKQIADTIKDDESITLWRCADIGVRVDYGRGVLGK